MRDMRQIMVPIALIAAFSAGVVAFAPPALAEEQKPKSCRMEQQCHWENFKKICVYVKVCR